MVSFPSAATSVFHGMAAPLWASIQSLPRPLPRFKLVPATRPVVVDDLLSTVLDAEIIPRLALAHPIIIADANPAESRSAISPEMFARTILDRDGSIAGSLVAEAARGGAEAESLYDDLLAPTAFLLADMWRDDRLSYSEVTIGLSRLQRLVHDLPRETAYNGENDDAARSALFSPRPGEQQTFGFFMIEERFRWGGWRTWIETSSSREDLVANVQRLWFDMVCLSVSRANDLAGLTEDIAAIRRASRNPEVVIAMDGAPFADSPEHVTTVGADAVASCGGDILHVVARNSMRVATA